MSRKIDSELRTAVSTLKPYFVRAAWFSVCSCLLILAPSVYMLEVYDRVINSRSHQTLAMLTLVVLAAYIVMEILEWARAEIMQGAGLHLDKLIRNRIFSAIFDANLKRVAGGTTQPLSDLRAIRDFFGSPPALAVMEAPVSLVFLGLVFAISPVLGWSAVIGSVLQVFLGWLNEKSTQPPLIAANRSSLAAQQYVDGSLRNSEVIESMGMLRDIHRRWMAKQKEFLNLQALASDKAGAFQAATKFLQVTMGSLLLGLGAWLLLHDSLNGGAGMMIIGSVLGGRVLAPLVQIVTQWRQVINFRDAWQRLDNLLASVPTKAQAMPLPAPRGLLQVDSLIAGAPGGGPPIIKNLSFTLPIGEVLAVVGPSASGKSTLARLLVGIWPTVGGKVRLDGVDMYTWDKEELGPHVGYLPQGVELLDGTLAENISRFGEPQPAKVRAAAQAVGLHELIAGLPQGYDSPVGQEGAMLSGGQRQRVALARAIYGDPVLVVLDEPNSSLDELGDAALATAILELKARGTTFVVMTHRTSILAVADKMLVMHEGVAQAFGPRDDVLAALKEANEKATQSSRATAVAAVPRTLNKVSDPAVAQA
ncbi:MAG: type secretion system ATPase [Polaromonas sp.]|jgi:ATP-binding cassette subfamily C exporter for protease/lipase|nr:type secretion system ATPase [Polaromonas sp.]